MLRFLTFFSPYFPRLLFPLTGDEGGGGGGEGDKPNTDSKSQNDRPSRKLAGKFESPESLEEGYVELERTAYANSQDNARLKQELERLKFKPDPKPETKSAQEEFDAHYAIDIDDLTGEELKQWQRKAIKLEIAAEREKVQSQKSAHDDAVGKKLSEIAWNELERVYEKEGIDPDSPDADKMATKIDKYMRDNGFRSVEAAHLQMIQDERSAAADAEKKKEEKEAEDERLAEKERQKEIEESVNQSVVPVSEDEKKQRRGGYENATPTQKRAVQGIMKILGR